MATSVFCEEDVECGICGNRFDEKVYVPKRLNCPHTLCIICIKQMTKPNKCIKCPYCNKDQKINIQELFTDLATLRLLEVMKYFGVGDTASSPPPVPSTVRPFKIPDVEYESPQDFFVTGDSSNTPADTRFEGKQIDYESRGLWKMRFKEGHMNYKFQCIVDIVNIAGSLYILDSRFVRKDTYMHVLRPSLDDETFVDSGFVLDSMETGCHGMTPINDETIAITNNECHQVVLYTTKGDLVSSFGSYGKGDWNFRDPRGIAYNNGKLYITDCLNSCISIWSVHGEFLYKIYDEEVIKYPMKIVINREEDIFVVCCNDYILVYGQDGNFKTNITHAGEQKLHEIRSIHIDNCGNLLVAGKESDNKGKKWTWCIDVFDPNLYHITRIQDKQRKLKFISSVTTAFTEDGDDVIVVGDSAKAAVYFF